jgi:hypothetical protein
MLETWAADAGTLISFGLRPKLRPAEDADYHDLVLRYGERPEFAVGVRELAAGLGLRVLAVSERVGVVVGAAGESPFAVRIADYAKEASVEGRVSVRVMHGLAHLAIAAACFPRAADLDDRDRLARVSVVGIDRYLRELCRRLDEEHEDDNLDPPSDDLLLERAWRAYAKRPPVMHTGDGRAGMRTTQQAISRALGWLVDQGMMTRVSDDDAGTFRSTERYRIQVKHLAAHNAWVELRCTMDDRDDPSAVESMAPDVDADGSVTDASEVDQGV